MRAFATLSPGDREALRLVAWDDLPLDQAARVAGTNSAAFRMRLSRARRRSPRRSPTSRPPPASAPDPWRRHEHRPDRAHARPRPCRGGPTPDAGRTCSRACSPTSPRRARDVVHAGWRSRSPGWLPRRPAPWRSSARPARISLHRPTPRPAKPTACSTCAPAPRATAASRRPTAGSTATGGASTRASGGGDAWSDSVLRPDGTVRFRNGDGQDIVWEGPEAVAQRRYLSRNFVAEFRARTSRGRSTRRGRRRSPASGPSATWSTPAASRPRSSA